MVDSGRPLQSAKKVPIMVTFVVEGVGGEGGRSVQRCIFKVRPLGCFETKPKQDSVVHFGSAVVGCDSVGATSAVLT